MAPSGETIVSSYSMANNFSNPPRLLKGIGGGLERTVSDITFEMSKEPAVDPELGPISEVEEAKCECCGMSEECTLEYVMRVRERFSGKWICGLCAEAVKEESEKNGGKKEDALTAHMSACVRFNKHGRANPVLCQANAMREIFRKSMLRAKSFDPRGEGHGPSNGGGIARSSSCIPAITRGMTDLEIAH